MNYFANNNARTCEGVDFLFLAEYAMLFAGDKVECH